MTDDAGTSTIDQGTFTPAVDSGSGPAGQTSATPAPAPTGGGNPAWEPIRSKLGPSFGLVEEHLKEWDRSAQTRIEQANSNAKRYESLGKYEELQLAQQLQQRLNSNPLEVYNLLQGYLSQNGLLEQGQDEGFDEYDGEIDPQQQQLEQLAASQQQIQEFLAAQQHEAAVASAEQELSSTMQAIRTQNDWLSEDDEREIFQRAYATAVQNDSEPDLQAAANDYIALRTRFLSTQRPGATAPRLVPSGGGAPGRGDAPNPAKMTPAQRQAYVADLLKANQSR